MNGAATDNERQPAPNLIHMPSDASYITQAISFPSSIALLLSLENWIFGAAKISVKYWEHFILHSVRKESRLNERKKVWKSKNEWMRTTERKKRRSNVGRKFPWHFSLSCSTSSPSSSFLYFARYSIHSTFSLSSSSSSFKPFHCFHLAVMTKN